MLSGVAMRAYIRSMKYVDQETGEDKDPFQLGLEAEKKVVSVSASDPALVSPFVSVSVFASLSAPPFPRIRLSLSPHPPVCL